MISLDDLVPENHIYRRFADLWKFEGIKNSSTSSKNLKTIEKIAGNNPKI